MPGTNLYFQAVTPEQRGRRFSSAGASCSVACPLEAVVNFRTGFRASQILVAQSSPPLEAWERCQRYVPQTKPHSNQVETLVPSHRPRLAVPPGQMRDLRSVGAKLKIVLNPSGDQTGVLTKLKDCERGVAACLSLVVPSCVALEFPFPLPGFRVDGAACLFVVV